MATTSLARQLEQLRAATVDGHVHKSTIAQQGPNLLSVQLSGEQLTLLAKDAFSKLCDLCPAISVFKSDIFKDDQDDFGNDDSDIEMEDGDETSRTLEDLLFILSPHILSKPAQYLLQYLLTKHKIHRKYPEALFFAALPYNEFSVFNKIVDCLPLSDTTSEHEDHPKWVRHFRQACYPATIVGLHRHLAIDRGFFNLICNLMVRLMKQHLAKFGRQDGVEYNKIIHFFATSVVNALNLCNTVTEYQTLDLMKVIIAGLKCNNIDKNSIEFKALASIIFAYLIPRVQLKTKVCKKLLAVLSKSSMKQKLSLETLTMAAILYRCQRQNIGGPKSKVLELILLHDTVMADAIENADRKDDDEKQFAKRLQKAMALLLDDVSESASAADLGHLLRMIFQSLVECLPSMETAEILIESVSKILLRYTKKLKKAKSQEIDSSMENNLKSVAALSNKILDSLRKKFAEEFSRKASNLANEKDIFVMDNEDEMPTPEQVSVKRILMDNPMIQSLMNEREVLPIGAKETFSKFSKAELKENSHCVKKIFGLVQPNFLLRHVQPNKLLSLVVGLMKLYDSRPQLLEKILNFVSSDVFLNDLNVKNEMNVRGVDFALIIMPLVFSSNEKISSIAFEKIKTVSKSSKLFSVVEKLDPSHGRDKASSLLTELIDFESATFAIDKILSTKTNQEPEIISSVLLFAASTLKKIESIENGMKLCQKLMLLVLIATQRCKIDVKESKSSDAFHELIDDALRKKMIPEKVYDVIVDSFKSLPKFCADSTIQLKTCLEVFVLGSCLKSFGLNSAAEKCFEIFSGKEDLLMVKVAAMKRPKEIFPLEKLGIKSDKLDTLFDAAQLHCAKQIDADKISGLLSLPYLLTCLGNEKRKVRKIVFKVVENLADKSSTKKSKLAVFETLLKQIVEHKSEILSNFENLNSIMADLIDNEVNEDVLNHLLSQIIATESAHVFVQLCPLLRRLSVVSAVQKISKFGLQILTEEEMDSEKSETLATLLSTFLPSILKQAADPCCWDLVVQSISCYSKTLNVNNLEKSVGVFSLESIYKTSKKLEDQVLVEKLFGLIIDQSGYSESSDVLMLARKICGVLKGITSKMFLAKLGSIWGEKLVQESQSGGRFSVRSVSQIDLRKNWKMTLFLLEIGLERLQDETPASLLALLKPLGILLKEALDQTDDSDTSYQLDLLLSSTLYIMDKAGSNSLNEKSINPELMVRCIRNCQNPNTKATALLILAKSSAANPEYILHNSIPIFTFMGTHFLKIDAKQSFDVACQAIDVIIPHIQSVCMSKQNGPKKMSETSLNILHTFADASVDMPHPHRVKTFMFKLLMRLGDREYLSTLTMLLLRKIDTNKPKKVQTRHSQLVENKLEQLKELFLMFDMSTQLHSVHKMIRNLRENSDEMKIIFGGKTKTSTQPNPEQSKAENILRVHMMAFVNYLLTSRQFVDQVSKRLQDMGTSDEESQLLYRQFEQLLEAAIINTDHFEQLAKSGNAKRQFVACCEKILESILSLLPLEVFVRLLSSLLLNQKNSVRRKMLEVFNSKLQQPQDVFIDESSLPSLLQPLLQLATGQGEPNPFNQQLALLCIRSFGRAVGSVYPAHFNAACKKLSDIKFLNSLENQACKAATLLCLTELCLSLGPLSVPLLPPFIKWMLELMSDPAAIVKDNAVVLNSIILSVQKCLENFGGFLNPFYKSLVVSTCRLAKVEDHDDDRKSQAMKNRLRHLCATISRSIPTQKLVDIAMQVYDELLLDDATSKPVIAFSLILRENLVQLDKTRALAVSSSCFRLFQHLLKYRTSLNPSEVLAVESHFIETFLTLMLKLSLDDFKPIFYRLFNLSYAGSDGDDIDGMTTMFHLTEIVAQKLKTLFGFISETLVQKTTNILNAYSKDDFQKLTNVPEAKAVQLVSQMLAALTVVFTHNQVESLLIKNYEDHVNAVLVYINAPIPDEKKDEILNKIRECLSQLAASTEDETQWKYLNYQVLLSIRSSDIKIRLFVLDMLDSFLDKKGENYLTVLPDSVPLLAEALDDDSSKVEARCRKLIKKMEDIFGHSVETYFE